MHLNPHAKCRSSRFNLKVFKKEKRGSLKFWKYYSTFIIKDETRNMWLPIGCVCRLFRQNIHYFLTVRNHNSAVCATLPYSLIGDGRVGLIEGAFAGGSPCLACGDRGAFVLLRRSLEVSCMVGGGGGALTFLLEGIFVQFCTGLCGWVVGIPVGADCTPVVAGLFLFCCVLVERGEGLCCVSF